MTVVPITSGLPVPTGAPMPRPALYSHAIKATACASQRVPLTKWWATKGAHLPEGDNLRNLQDVWLDQLAATIHPDLDPYGVVRALESKGRWPADYRLVEIVAAVARRLKFAWLEACSVWVLDQGVRVPAAQDERIHFLDPTLGPGQHVGVVVSVDAQHGFALTKYPLDDKDDQIILQVPAEAILTRTNAKVVRQPVRCTRAEAGFRVEATG